MISYYCNNAGPRFGLSGTPEFAHMFGYSGALVIFDDNQPIDYPFSYHGVGDLIEDELFGNADFWQKFHDSKFLKIRLYGKDGHEDFVATLKITSEDFAGYYANFPERCQWEHLVFGD